MRLISNLKLIQKLISLLLMLGLISCQELMVGESPANTPQSNFQFMWDKYDSHYGLFSVKSINWDSIYDSHLPLAMQCRTDEELYEVLTSMTSNLHDKHVTLYPTDKHNLQPYTSGYNGVVPTQEDFLIRVVKENYLMEFHQINEDLGYGKLENNIGYIHMSKFVLSLADFKKDMDKVLSALATSKAIIVDIRDHNGGDDRVSKYIAGRFADSKKLFMTSKKRNGPKHDNFESEIYWYVDKEGDSQYTKPVILLTTRHSISAAETFTFAMRENSNVTHLGDTTAGAFSDQVIFELPNRWYFTVAVGDYRGSDGKSYEGVGIAPHVYSKNLKADVLAGMDKTLEMAIEQLQ